MTPHLLIPALLACLATVACHAQPATPGQVPAQTVCSDVQQKFVPSRGPRQSDDPLLRAVFTTGDTTELAAALASTDVDARRGSTETTALVAAAAAGNMAAVQLLLGHGADPELADASGDRPIEAAVANGQLAATCLLLEQGSPLPTPEAWPYLLPVVVLAEDPAAATGLARLLLRHGFDPNVRMEGYTALHFAAGLGNAPLVQLLLASGASAHAKDAKGRTALEVAREAGHPEIETLLSAADASHRQSRTNP